jgi:hypothetical protein
MKRTFAYANSANERNEATTKKGKKSNELRFNIEKKEILILPNK